MKRLLSLFLLSFAVTIGSAVELDGVSNLNDCSSIMISNNYVIEGETSYNIGSSGSGVGGVYTLSPNIPVGATTKWNIQGNRGYVYPNGNSCSVNIYTPGSYRLSCVVTESDGSFTEAAIYITVMP